MVINNRSTGKTPSTVIGIEGDGKYIQTVDEKGKEYWHVWMDLRLDIERETSLKREDDMRISFSQMDIECTLLRYYHAGIFDKPDYQRDHVWSEEDKVALIHSIYQKTEIGKIVLVEIQKEIEGGYYTYEVLDGKQRLRALTSFYEDRFQYQGYYFSELGFRDRLHFLRTFLSLGIVSGEITREQKLRYFLRLNQSSRVMSKEHLEKVEMMILSGG